MSDFLDRYRTRRANKRAAYDRLRAADRALMVNTAAEIAAGIDYETDEYLALNSAVIAAEADCTRAQVWRNGIARTPEWKKAGALSHGPCCHAHTPHDDDSDDDTTEVSS